MKKWIAIVLLVALTLLPRHANAFAFTDITNWTGSGSNQAALVIDWNLPAGNKTLVWGYRWNGTATGQDMLRSIVDADARLFANTSTPGGFGSSLYGLGYDADGDGGAFTFTGTDTATASDPDDYLRTGWLSLGYWAYYLSANGTSWGFSGSGMTGRNLTNGAWDGWSFAPGFSSSVPTAPFTATEAASPVVPEPATLGLVAIGLSLGGLRRKLRRAV